MHQMPALQRVQVQRVQVQRVQARVLAQEEEAVAAAVAAEPVAQELALGSALEVGREAQLALESVQSSC